MSAVLHPARAPARVGWLTLRGLERPWIAIWLSVLVAILFALALPRIVIDTNPKNSLPADAPVRVWNEQVDKRFGLHEDTIVVAIRPEEGVLTPASLRKLYDFSNDVLALDGVVKADVTSIYTVDNLTSKDESLRIAPLLSRVPDSQAGIDALRKELFEGPLFLDRLISRDGKTTAIYVPMQQGADGAKLSAAIRKAALKTFTPDQIYLTGEPVARDQFGADMFKLMAIFAPIANALMVALMFWMFRSWWIAGIMMLGATVSIMVSMGAAVALGFPIHIMGSMAPVFLLAIATDAIHIFNEFFQRWGPGKDRAEVIRQTMAAVARPVRYTALATALGFAVLLFMTIVPVKIFGGIVVFGTVVLRLLSFYLVPACLALVPLPDKFEPGDAPLARFTNWVASWAVQRSALTITATVLLVALGAWGASKSVIDNNMVRWFKEGSEVRQADALFSREMGGATPASLVIDTGKPDGVKDPAVLAAIQRIQSDLAEQQLVGASLSVADYLKRINHVLDGRAAQAEVLPSSADSAGQYLMAFSMGARPSDLNRVVDFEYRRANILLQLRSGDAKAMQRLEDRVSMLVREQKMPFTVSPAGPAHFNLVWNEVVLDDMLFGFAIALLVVFGVLAADFRSMKWALVAYVPLLVTVLLIVGALGWLGKTIDMPVAVLSCLSLGMAVDFAIHFVTRYRQQVLETGDGGPVSDEQRAQALSWAIRWPGKGIARNALMFAVAFAVMLAAPLTPYITVGAFIVSMMTLSAVASLTLVPALIKTFRL
jgi:predicted RND superfamily exporter protein